MRNLNSAAGRAHRRVPTSQRRFAWVGLITILTLLLSFFPQVVPGAPVPTASAHNLQTRMVSMFMDSATQACLDARLNGTTLPPGCPALPSGWAPGQPLLQQNDELALIIKVVPRDGTTTGVGGHVDFYVPNGVQVTDVGYVVPDGAGGFTLVSMKGQSPIAIGDGPIGAKSTTQLVDATGWTGYTNILGVTEAPVVPASGLHRGTLAGVYGDTGIFFSTDPDTAYGSWQAFTGDSTAKGCGSLAFNPDALGKTLVNNSGDTVVPCNKWDAEQLMAWGVKGGTFGQAAPIVDYGDGRGNAPWGFASGVGGPQSGYKWNFNWDEWQTSGKTAADMRNAMGNDEVGPWQRVKYNGSRISKDQPGLVSTVLGQASIDGSSVGTAVPLPATTSQTDSTSPKTIRWAVGQLTAYRPEYAWIKIKVNSAAEITDPSGCPVFKGDTFGGDAGGTDNGKDHLWRYYEPTEVTWNGCLAAQKTASREIVKVGDTYQYKLKVYNLQAFTLSSVVVRDPILSGVTFISAVPAQSSGPTPLVWNVGTLLPGQKWEATVTVKAASSGFIDNCITIDSNSPTGPFPTQTACDSTISGSYPYLVPSKTVTPTSAAPGETVTYDILVKNVGTGPTGSPVVISDFLPGGLTFKTSFTPIVTVNGAAVTNYTPNTTNLSNPTISVPVAINGGSQLTLKFQAVVPSTLAAGAYCNSYSVTQNGVPITTGSEACLTVNAGTIGDTIFRDWDGDGTQDKAPDGVTLIDEGLLGVTVNLYAGACPPSGGIIKTTTTDDSGNYLFSGLGTPPPAGAGDYCVDPVAPAGYTSTTAEPRPVSLATNGTDLTADFGFKPGGAGSIGDKVFEDIANNGVFDGADVGIDGVTVTLYEDTNGNGVIDAGTDALVATTTTAGGGNYSFALLDPTRYYVVLATDGAGSAVDNYFTVNPYVSSTGGSKQIVTPADFVAAPTNNVTDADFGYFGQTPGSIGDTVCRDSNANSLCDAGEPGIPNVTVSLYLDADGDGLGDLDELVTTTTSDITGKYLFPDLGPGAYVVQVDKTDPDVPDGYVPEIELVALTLTAGQNRTDVDFPFIPLITKTVSKANANAGDTLTYTTTLNYQGSDLLSNVRVVDPLPAGTTYVAGSANLGGVYGAYTTIPGEPGVDDQGTFSTGTTLTASPIAVAKNGTINVSMVLTSTQAIASVTPAPLTINGGSGSCSGPSPASGNVPAGGAGLTFTFTCTPTSLGEYTLAGSATDGTYNFAEGISNSVLVSASGSSNVVTWNLGSNNPGTPGVVIASGTLPGIYAFQGGTAKFWRYATTLNSWTDNPADTANNVKKGGALTYDGTYIYGFRGDKQKTFYRYTISSPGSWTTRANTSDNVDEGGALQYLNVGGTNYIFATLGNSNRFRRYSISGNSWSNMADTPAIVKKGGALTTDGTYIYALQGDLKTGFWRYDPGANSWTARANVPGGVGWGGSLTRIGNYIYAMRGNITQNFYRYDITANTWSSRANTPGKVQDGGALTTDGTYVYAFQGKTNGFWRYDPASNTWAAKANAFGITNQGGALVFVPGTGTADRSTQLSAVPTMVNHNGQVVLTMELEANTNIATVTPSAVTVTPTGGASATCGSPTPASQAVTANVPATFTWTCTVTTATLTPGTVEFAASATGTGGANFSSATSNTVLAIRPLTFRVTVNAGATIIENIAVLSDDGGAIGVGIPSDKTQTTTGASIGDFVWADLNGNGLQVGEPGIPGAVVWLDTDNDGVRDAGEPFATTDSLGGYLIPGLTAGAYNVKVDLSTVPGYIPTTATGMGVTLTTGQQYKDADFGLQPAGTASIGDTVWLDANSNGSLDGTEQGLPNVTVKLYKDMNQDGTVDAGDVLLGTQTTDANGTYLFTGLQPADYLVVVDESSAVTSPYDGAPTIAAAMAPTTGTFNPRIVTISTPGQSVLDADFGYNWAGSIGDYVWWDNNYNGAQDESPATPIAGAIVLLYYDANGNGVLDALNGDYQIGFDITDASGAYRFDNLPPGKYLVDVYEDSITTDGVRDIVPTTLDVVAKNLGLKEPYLGADFGYYVGAKVEGNVFWDENHNGVLDAAEKDAAYPTGHLLKNVAVSIVCAGTDGMLGTTDDYAPPSQDTDSSGHFAFIVPPGLCTVSYTTVGPGIPSALGDKTTPVSYTFTAVAGEDWHPSFDFGRDNTGTIGDTVYNDLNGNGSQDAGEPGLAGVTVRLYDNTGATLLATTATDSQGKYLFVGLPDGSYKVDPDGTTVPAGFGLTTANDPDTATVAGGGSDLLSDFGYKYTPPGGTNVYTLAGIVWKDLDGNGVYDGADTPISGVSVTLACGAYGTYVLPTDGGTISNYALNNVPDGTSCTITVNPATLPSGAYVQTGDPDSTCPGPNCNNQTSVTVSGGNPPLQNFGYQEQFGSISGTVCVGDGDGFCDDPGDTPIQGVTVKLWYAGLDNILGSTDDITTTVTTDLSGNYAFPNLAPGTYQVLETDLPGYTSLNDADGGDPNNVTVILPLGGVITDRDFEDDRLGDVTVTKTLLLPDPGPATISDTVKFEIVVKNTGQSLLTTVPLWDYYSPACLENPVTTPGIIVYVDNLQPDWAAAGGGGVFSAYIPTEGTYVSPGTTTLYNGREAGIIKAGYTATAPWDEGLFAFRPTVTIDALAAGTLTYDVITQAGVNPVWMTIEIDTGIAGDRSDNTTYQHVPTSNPAGWHTVNAGAGLWQKWNNNQGDVTGNPLISLSAVAAAHPGLNVVRTYLRLGMGLSYYNGGTSTIAWVDKAVLGGVTYDFVLTGGTVGTGTNPALGILHWPNLGPLAPGKAVTVTVDYHANITDAMYWKEGGWLDYAPNGMPDFDQKQDAWFNPATMKWSFCGPVAAANSLWWFDSKFEPNPVPPPAVNDGYNLVTAYGQWDDHDARNVQPFVGNLAALMGTTPANGTNVANLANGISTYLTQKGLINDYTVTVLPKPPFEWVESEVRRSEDVILLLGFWQAVAPGQFERIGGHYVTVAGIDSLNQKIGFSDPYRNAAEAGDPGRILPNPHLDLHPAQPPDEVHNNAKYLSHDVYAFTPSPSPGGIWGPAGYAESCTDIDTFAGQNAGDLPNGGTCQPAFPIYTEVEYAVAVSPKTPTVTCDPTTNIAVVSGAYDQSGLLLPEAQAHAQVRIVEEPGIGVAKRVVEPVANNGDGTYTVEYSVRVQNVGNVPLNNVQVTDNLALTFTGATSWNVVAGSISATGGLTANTNFDGTSDKNLLSTTPSNSLASLTQGTITFKVLVKPGSKLSTYNNTAIGSGVSPLGATVTDDSQDGVDTDPDTGGLTPADNPNPGDDNVSTPVDFTEKPLIGIAKEATQVKNNGNGTYVVTFTLTVENFGDVVLNNLVITDAITTQFAGMNPTGFAAINGTLNASGTWNGTAGSNILAAGQSLAAGATGTVKIRFTVTPGYPRTVDNFAYVRGTSPAGTTVTDQSTVGIDPDNDGGAPGNDNNNDPADNTTPTPVTFTESPVIGVAKSLQSAVDNSDGTHTVTYLLTVENLGDVTLVNVQVTDELAAAFASATGFSDVSVTTSAGLNKNPGYTGIAPNRGLLLGSDTLAVGATGTITLVVKVTPGSKLGPYDNQATASADSPSGGITQDLSDNGTEPDPNGNGNPNEAGENDLTPVTFTARTQIGAAKDSTTVVNNGDGTYDVTYSIVVENLGSTTLTNVQVSDNLATTFTVLSKNSGTLAINAGYTGSSPNTNLLLGTDTLNPGGLGAITLVVRVTPKANLGPYNNQARATATGPGSVPTADNSDHGTDPDPNGNGNPNESGENDPTPVTFTEAPAIGIAKAVQSQTNNSDGTFTVVYAINVKNLGDIVLNDVQVTDNLATTFAAATSWNATITSVSAGWTANPSYTGSTPNISLLTATGNSLAVGATKTIVLTVTVQPAVSPATYNNQATATGVSPAGTTVTDLSDDGTAIDPDGDKNANEPGENDLTPVAFTQTPGIALVKTGPAVSYVGETITYTYTVTNTGNVALSSVTVSDDKCSPVTYVSGDADNDGKLDVTETWKFTCTYTVKANDPNPLVNHATAQGVPPLGGQPVVSQQVSWSVPLVTFRVGDMVWLDDGDGVQESGETTGLYNVPITITGTDINGNPVNFTVYTDINGHYVANFPLPGTYTATAPAGFGGYTHSSVSSLGFTLTPANPQQLDIDFGYVLPTGIHFLGLQTVPSETRIQLSWQVTPVDGSGLPRFHVWRSVPDGAWKRLTVALLEPVSSAGDVLEYSYVDAAVETGVTYLYRLETEDGVLIGPWQVKASIARHFFYLPFMRR